jgi:hypothetical protein
MATNLGKWERWYVDAESHPYGSEETYKLGAEFLKGCAVVEDWGCGLGWMRQFVRGCYVGIDGSLSPYADKIVDLATYRSQTPGLFMRHVLEHDYRWKRILGNAIASFTERMVLVLFTPLQDQTRQLAFADDPGVPDIGFALADLTPFFEGLEWKVQTLETATQYGIETVFCLQR